MQVFFQNSFQIFGMYKIETDLIPNEEHAHQEVDHAARRSFRNPRRKSRPGRPFLYQHFWLGIHQMAWPHGILALAYAKDPEGNIFGIMHSDPQAK